MYSRITNTLTEMTLIQRESASAKIQVITFLSEYSIADYGLSKLKENKNGTAANPWTRSVRFFGLS